MHDELLLHQDFLERLARRLVRDKAGAGDLVQDTWLQALARPPRDRGALRTWLATVARRLAHEHARTRERRHAREHAVAREERIDGDIAAVDLRLDFQAILLERLRALPEAQRHALALRYVDDLGPAQIAERLGVSLDTVKTRLRRGLATLRADLDRASGGDRSAWSLALLPGLARESAVALPGGGSVLVLTGGILMTKVAVAAVVVGLLAGALWLGSTRGERPAVERPSALAPSSDRVEREEAARDEVARPEQHESARQLLADAGARPSAAQPSLDTIPVRVVERASGRPLPSAEVRWLHYAAGDTETHARVDRQHVDELLAERGALTHVDEDGWARIPRESGRLAITGSAPGLWILGATHGDGPGELRLELERDVSLDVLVVDARGTPAANVPVAWTFLAENARPLTTVRTSADGRARLAHAPDPGEQGLAVALATLLRAPVREVVDLDAPPSEVVLVLPATASFDVLARTPEGQPAAVRHVSAVSVAPPARAGEPALRVPYAAAVASLEDGRTRFEHVEPGLHLSIHAWPEGSDNPTSLFVAGPVLAGEHRTFEIVLGSGHAILRLRALDARGMPLCDAELSTSVALANVLGASELKRARTDDQGRFEVQLSDGEHTARQGAARTLRVWRTAEADVAPLEGVLPLEPSYPHGVRELGDVQLAPAPLLVGGKVLDASGEPLANATVGVQLFDADVRFAPPPRPGAAPEQGPAWRPAHRTARTDEAGRFQIHGELPPGRLAAFASHGERRSASIEFLRGEAALRLQLPGTGYLAGRVVTDAALPVSSLRITARLDEPGESGPAAGTERAGRVRPDGSLVVPDLPVGRWRLRVESVDVGVRAGLDLVTLEGLEVRAGETTRDVRLDPLDLRGLLRIVRIELVAPAGSPAPKGRGEWREARQGGFSGSRAIVGGVVTIYPRELPIDVGIVAEGYRSVVLESLSEDRVIELEPGFELLLRLPDDIRVTPPRRIVANVWHDGPLGISGAGGTVALPFDERGELALRTGGPGTVNYMLHVEREPGGAAGSTPLLPLLRHLELTDHPGEQVHVLDIPRAQLDAALERLGG